MTVTNRKYLEVSQLYRVSFVGLLYFSAVLICLLSFWANQSLPIENGGVAASIHSFFYIDFESNLPTWFSSLQLFILAVLLGIVAWKNLIHRQSTASYFLLFLASFFLVCSLDETAEMHERFGILTDMVLLGNDRTNTVFHDTGVWALVLGVPVASLLFFVILKLKSFFAWETKIVVKYVAGLVLFFGGAVGLELVVNFFSDPLARSIARHLEELFEMAGVTTMIWATLDLLAVYRFQIILNPAVSTSPKSK